MSSRSSRTSCAPRSRVFVDLYLKQKQLAEQERAAARERACASWSCGTCASCSQSEARFREIVGSAMDAIIAFDADGRITLFNAAAERMFGLSARDAIGHDVRKLDARAPAPGVAGPRVPSARTRRTAGAQTEPAEHIAVAHRAPRQRRGVPDRGVGLAASRCAAGAHYTLIVRDISERKRSRGGAQGAGRVARADDDRAQGAQRGAEPTDRRSWSAR